jgi:hypothetical protein
MEYIAFDAHKHYTLASVVRPNGNLVRDIVPAARASNNGAGSSISAYLSGPMATIAVARSLPPTVLTITRRFITG